MAAIIREDPTALPDSLPGPLRWTIERCLAKEPAQRYDATRDLFLEFRQLLDHASELTGTAPAVEATAASKRPRWLWPAGALAALAVGFVLAQLGSKRPSRHHATGPLRRRRESKPCRRGRLRATGSPIPVK